MRTKGWLAVSDVSMPSYRRHILRIFAAGAFVASVCGCGSQSSSNLPLSDRPPTTHAVQINNGTDLMISVKVNGSEVASVNPRTNVAVAQDDLPPTPWTVTAHTPSHEVISFTVPSLTGVGNNFGYGQALTMSCGRLDVFVGPPLLGPAFVSPQPSDCY